MHFQSMPNLTLGSGSLYLKDDIFKPIAFTEEIPEYISSVNIPLSADAEFEMEAEINPQVYSKLAGIDLSSVADASAITMIFSQPYQEQVRRHKKKRINKKWAKRYGYRTKYKKYQINEISYISDGYGRIDITGKDLRLMRR